MSDESVVIDLETGAQTRVPLTAEEKAERAAQANAAAAGRTAQAQEWAAVKAAWQVSGDPAATQAQFRQAIRTVIRAMFRQLDEA